MSNNVEARGDAFKELQQKRKWLKTHYGRDEEQWDLTLKEYRKNCTEPEIPEMAQWANADELLIAMANVEGYEDMRVERELKVRPDRFQFFDAPMWNDMTYFPTLYSVKSNEREPQGRFWTTAESAQWETKLQRLRMLRALESRQILGEQCFKSEGVNRERLLEEYQEQKGRDVDGVPTSNMWLNSESLVDTVRNMETSSFDGLREEQHPERIVTGNSNFRVTLKITR